MTRLAGLGLLYETYKTFLREGTTLDKVLQEWEEIKTEINSAPGLRARNFHDLWAQMLVQFTDDYPLVLRLVAIMLIIPADTKECERIFSLMNDLKSAERNSLSQEYLRALMIWFGTSLAST